MYKGWGGGVARCGEKGEEKVGGRARAKNGKVGGEKSGKQRESGGVG